MRAVIFALVLSAGAYAVHRSLPIAAPAAGTEKRRPAAASPAPAKAGGWTYEISEQADLRVRYAFSEVLSFKYAFWGTEWGWTWAEPRRVPTPRGALAAFQIFVRDLGTVIDLTEIKAPTPNEPVYHYKVNVDRKLHHVVGGGLEFALATDSAAFGERQHPELVSKRGFVWQPFPNETVSVKFDASLAVNYLEPGSDRKAIRSFFYGAEPKGVDVEPGTRTFTMTVRLPSGTTRRANEAERFGVSARASDDWHVNTMPWDSWPVDMSFLSAGERPAGKRGRVKARGEDLVFEDGTQARFWGTNIQAYTLFTGDKPAIANQAKRLAALGYNLVRLSHHDAAWVVPNVFVPGDTTRRLNDDALAHIDWWVKCLRDEGIYVWLDLKMERTFRVGDGVEGLDELTRSEPWGRGFYFVNQRLEELGQEFAKQYLARNNRFTGLSYLNDPAILGVVITNEDDLVSHFGNMMLAKNNHTVHTRLLRARIDEVAPRLKVTMDEAMRTWEPGPSKVVLADLEARLFQRAGAHLRKLGYKGLVASGNYWGDSSFYMLASLTTGDVIDAHAYGTIESLSKNPRVEPNFITYLAAAAVGKPVTITEWNVEYPTRDRFIAPLYAASIATLQGWDAPMIYGYWQQSVEAHDQVDVWSSIYDPALTALMPAAAILYRQRHVREATKSYRIDLDKKGLYFTESSPKTSAALRTLAEQSKVTLGLPDLPELPWDGDTRARGAASASQQGPRPILVRDPDQDFIPPDRTSVVSDTGELTRDWARGVQTINTPRTQAASGFVGGGAIELRDVTLNIKTSAAAVAFSSLDGLPIGQSRRLLLTVVGQAEASEGRKMPMRAQPIEGSVTIKTNVPLQLVPLSPAAYPVGDRGAGFKPIPPARKNDGSLTFEIPSRVPTHWFALQP